MYKRSHPYQGWFQTIFLTLIKDGYVSGKTPFDDSQVDSARSGIIYQLIAKEQTVSSAALMVRPLIVVEFIFWLCLYKQGDRSLLLKRKWIHIIVFLLIFGPIR